jgi:hypothetical protein
MGIYHSKNESLKRGRPAAKLNKILVDSNSQLVGGSSPVVLTLLFPVHVRPPSIGAAPLTPLRLHRSLAQLLGMIRWRWGGFHARAFSPGRSDAGMSDPLEQIGHWGASIVGYLEPMRAICIGHGGL